jgi:uncharacterized repeat protein (TIGR01451 family)
VALDRYDVTNVTSGTGDIEIEKWAYDYWVKPGDSTTYEICVYNYGGVSGNVSMNDTLPDGWTFYENPYGVYGDCTTVTRNENTFILGTLPSDEYCCFYYDVNVPEDETAGERCMVIILTGNISQIMMMIAWRL